MKNIFNNYLNSKLVLNSGFSSAMFKVGGLVREELNRLAKEIVNDLRESEDNSVSAKKLKLIDRYEELYLKTLKSSRLLEVDFKKDYPEFYERYFSELDQIMFDLFEKVEEIDSEKINKIVENKLKELLG